MKHGRVLFALATSFTHTPSLRSPTGGECEFSMSLCSDVYLCSRRHSQPVVSQLGGGSNDQLGGGQPVSPSVVSQ